MALAIGFQPAHLIPYWGLDTSDGKDGRSAGGGEPERRLAIGPSGPAIPPPSQEEIAARAGAVNFNPNHDRWGRFTTGDHQGGAGGSDKSSNDREHQPGFGARLPRPDVYGLNPHRHHSEHPAQRKETAGAAKQKDASKGSVGSIGNHPYGSPNEATCTAVAIQTIIAAMTQKEAPALEEIKKQLERAAAAIPKRGRVTIDWDSGGINTSNTSYAAIVQKVLADNGVKTENNLGGSESNPQVKKFTMEQIAGFLVASGTPAMIDINTGNSQKRHSVTMQWDPGAGRFRVNNRDAHGGSELFTREKFLAGSFERQSMDTGEREFSRPSFDCASAIIFAEKP